MDRISNLPEPIIQHILYFLHQQSDTEQVAQTMLLSKAWIQVWNSFPFLRFHYRLPKTLEGFLNFVEHTLQNRRRQRISIRDFELHMSNCYEVELDYVKIDRLIGYAVELNVTNLILTIVPWSSNGHKFPLKTVFSAKSLTLLDLQGSMLVPFDDDFGMRAKCSELRKLRLSKLHVHNQTLEDLINSSFPEIEELSCTEIEGFRSLRISSGCCKLKAVRFDSCYELERLEIEAPNLEKFMFGSNGTNFGSTYQINIEACKNLKSLCLWGGGVTSQLFHDIFSKHLLIEHLSLRNLNDMGSIKISSNCLKSLRLAAENPGLVVAEINAPSLHRFEYSCRRCLPSISLNSETLSLARLTISLLPRPVDLGWHMKLIEILGKFITADEVILNYHISSMRIRTSIVPPELRQPLVPPLYNVKHLTAELWGVRETATDTVDIVDSLLWMCPHPSTLSISINLDHSHQFLEFHYHENLTDGEDVSTKNWQHCLKEVKIKNLERWEGSRKLPSLQGMNDAWGLKKLFLENAKKLERIDVDCPEIN